MDQEDRSLRQQDIVHNRQTSFWNRHVKLFTATGTSSCPSFFVKWDLRGRITNLTSKTTRVYEVSRNSNRYESSVYYPFLPFKWSYVQKEVKSEKQGQTNDNNRKVLGPKNNASHPDYPTSLERGKNDCYLERHM